MQTPLRIVFVTNFYTSHQEPLSEELYRLTDGNYYFIETKNVRGGQKQKDLNMDRPFVLHYWDMSERERCEELILQADVALIGTAPDRLFLKRLRKKKLTFRYTERLYKRPLTWRNCFHAMAGAWLHHGRFQHRPLYILCASAFTAADCRKFGNYRSRAYRWGYFPAVKEYDIETILDRKQPASILWTGRMISWKHPEAALQTALKLKQAGYDFELRFVGDGNMRQMLEMQAASLNLTDCVHFLGALRPERVREEMARAEIFLFTSDRGEGWGAVLNEAMNGGCATVSSHSIGSVPYLIEDGENGLIYPSGNIDALTRRVQFLLDHPAQRRDLGHQAYRTVAELWNGRVAAERLIALSEDLLSGKKSSSLYVKGPCSPAEIRKDDWYTGE